MRSTVRMMDAVIDIMNQYPDHNLSFNELSNVASCIERLADNPVGTMITLDEDLGLITTTIGGEGEETTKEDLEKILDPSNPALIFCYDRGNEVYSIDYASKEDRLNFVKAFACYYIEYGQMAQDVLKIQECK